MVEREPTIGGIMPLLGKTFPEDSCAICIGGPKMADIGNEPNIKLLDYSEVVDVEQLPVGYHVKVKRKPRYIDHEKCVACGQCSEVCPVEVPSEIEGQLASRKAAFIPYAQSIPRKYLIDPESCLYLDKGSCRLCERVCPNDAIDFNQKEELVDLYVGSIILATGFDNFDPKPYPQLGAQYENVLDQYQVARLLDGEGPTAGVFIKPSDGEKPEKVIMIQCVGSRDPEFNPWCSRYCCMAAMKHAEEIKLHQGGNIDVTILYKDIRAGGKYYEEFYNRVKRLGINFVNGNLEQVAKLDDGTFVVQYNDALGKKATLTGDMVVLSTGMEPSKGTRKLTETIGIEVDKYGFLAEVDPKVASVTTKKPGIYICGAGHSPKDIPESVAQASAAATMSSLYLLRAVDPEKEILSPNVNRDNCGRCGICVSVCPYNAISMPKTGPVEISNELCQACGLCMSSCPTRALDNPNYGFDITSIQVKKILEDRDPRETSVIGFLCNDCGYNLLDTAGFYGAKYTSAFLPVFVPCMSLVSMRHIVNAMDNGADGVMLIGCAKERCHYEKGVDHADGQLDTLNKLYTSVGKNLPVRTLKSCGSMLQQFLEELDDLVSMIEEEKR
jgi:heterodisulfide reductase subunit A